MDVKRERTEAKKCKSLGLKQPKSEVTPVRNGLTSKTFGAANKFRRRSGSFVFPNRGSAPETSRVKTEIAPETSRVKTESVLSVLDEKRKRTLVKIKKYRKKRRAKSGKIRSGMPDHVRKMLAKKGIFPKIGSNATNVQQMRSGVASSTFGRSKYKGYKRFLRKRNDKILGYCRIISRELFYVDVEYCEALVDIFKSVPTGIEDELSKKWIFSIDVHDQLLFSLSSLGETIFIYPIPFFVLQIFKRSEVNSTPEYDLSRMDQVLVNALLPFQKKGLYFGIQHGGKILLADDMGLGKTIQAIAIANYFMEDWPLLIVTPSSVKYAWLEAFHNWLPSLDASEINVIDSGRDLIASHRVVIMSYDLLGKFETDIMNKGFKSVIFDESHYLKNMEAARTQAAQAVIKSMKRVLMLSGTPALARPIELFTQLTSLCPQYFNSYKRFGMRYCGGKDFSGASNVDELRLVLEDLVLIRRLKSEVLAELPSKFRQMIVLNPSQISISANNENFRLIPGDIKIKKSADTMKYFLETGEAKIPAVCQYVSDLLDSNKKFLCFAHHVKVMDALSNCIENKKIDFIRIDGSVSAEQRKELCERFQSSEECRVAVLSITAANVGITLTAASLVVFAELFWTPAALIQAEDRAHRIGQVNSIVVQYLVARRTADDMIWPLIQRKLDTLKKVGLSKDNFRSADRISMDDQFVLQDAFGDLELPDITNFEEKGISTKIVKPEELSGVIEHDDKNKLVKRVKLEKLPEVIELEDDDENMPVKRVKLEESSEIIELVNKDVPKKHVKVEKLPEVIEIEDDEIMPVKREKLPEIYKRHKKNVPKKHVRLAEVVELDNDIPVKPEKNPENIECDKDILEKRIKLEKISKIYHFED